MQYNKPVECLATFIIKIKLKWSYSLIVHIGYLFFQCFVCLVWDFSNCFSCFPLCPMMGWDETTNKHLFYYFLIRPSPLNSINYCYSVICIYFLPYKNKYLFNFSFMPQKPQKLNQTIKQTHESASVLKFHLHHEFFL